MNTRNSTRVKASTITRPEVLAHSDSVREDECPLSNPTGRSVDDGVKNSKVNTKEKTKQKLMNCRREILISTMNMRTISAEFKRKELAYQFTSKGLSVLGIQDHKIVHSTEEDKIRTEMIDGCTLITTSAWRNDRNAAVGGVGLMLNKYAADALSDVVAYNSRIIIAHFSGNPSMSVIVTHGPHWTGLVGTYW